MNSAIVVLYNPELGHLIELLGVLKKQVDKVVLVDNTPKLIKEYNENLFLDFNKINILMVVLKMQLKVCLKMNVKTQR